MHHALRGTLLLLLALSGCKNDTIVATLKPGLGLAPDQLDFGDIAVPTARTLELYVSNSGRAELRVEANITGEDRQAFELLLDEAAIPAGESLAIPVRFSPDTFLDFEASLVLTSNDEENPERTVPIFGTGVSAPLPDIEIEPGLSLDFGAVEALGNSVQYVQIANVGTAPLTLGQVSQSGSGAFRLETDPAYATVAPNATLPVILRYEPGVSTGDSGVLTIRSDDPDEPSVDVLLLGNGGADIAYPEAVIVCPTSVGPPEYVTLDGSQSNDPEGHLPLTYEWELTQTPAGSQSDLQLVTANTASYFADVAGTFAVELSVVNAIGVRSAPTICEMEAIPEDELHVELTWDTPRADLDLHLSRGGASLFDLPGDVSYCNQSPQWGASGAADDPRFDIDDRGGLGPENINIRTPASDTYTVSVHYFDDHGDQAATATVRVWAYGALAWEGQRLLQRNEVWEAALVNWPAGTVGALSSPNFAAPKRSCN